MIIISDKEIYNTTWRLSDNKESFIGWDVIDLPNIICVGRIARCSTSVERARRRRLADNVSQGNFPLAWRVTWDDFIATGAGSGGWTPVEDAPLAPKSHQLLSVSGHSLVHSIQQTNYLSLKSQAKGLKIILPSVTNKMSFCCDKL